MNVKDHSICGAAPAIFWRSLAAGMALATSVARADTNTDVLTVRAETVTNQAEAYAAVEPIALLPVRVTQSGALKGFEIVPGTKVQAGQKLVELAGPEIQVLVVQDETGVTTAQTNLFAAQKALAIQQEQLDSHLTTRQMLHQAESAVAQAQSAFDTAQGQLTALKQAMALKAPADGTVVAVNAAEGQWVSAGDTILTMQAANKLWLKAVYYGNDAATIQVGMTGRFMPADGGKEISVKVCTVIGAEAVDGGQSVGLLATQETPDWRNGESGTVILDGAARSLVAVPTRALILDQGKWWVLVHKADGNHPQAVTPGPSRDWQTFIERGLEPGTAVVVGNAYLEYHRGISDQYQPPD